MMHRLAILACAFALGSCIGDVPPPPNAEALGTVYTAPVPVEEGTLRWAGLEPAYTDVSEIKAQLRNTSGATVYRSWIWPEMFARLERWDETLREWRAGDIGVLCGTVEDPFEPLPFPPEATLSVDVYYDDSFFESDGKLLFLAEGPRGEAYPAAGKYRLALLYARQPWAVDKNPRLIFLTASPAFRLNPPVLRRQTPAG